MRPPLCPTRSWTWWDKEMVCVRGAGAGLPTGTLHPQTLAVKGPGASAPAELRRGSGSPGKDHSLCCPTPWASGPHTLGLGGRAWPPGDGPCLRAPGSMPGDLFLRLD